MHIRYMTMLVHERLVTVPMGVRLARRIIRPMGVPMVLIVHMRMGMLQRLVDVFVGMVLGEVQPDTEAHKQAGDHEL